MMKEMQGKCNNIPPQTSESEGAKRIETTSAGNEGKETSIHCGWEWECFHLDGKQ